MTQIEKENLIKSIKQYIKENDINIEDMPFLSLSDWVFLLRLGFDWR